MTISSHAVANAFIAIAGKEGKQLTNMQLQKLVFIAHGYCLAFLGTPLFFHNTHAWQWGPVVPKLYKALQKYGSAFIPEPIEADDTMPDTGDEAEILGAIWKSYGHYTGTQLSALTHKDNTPWSYTWDRNRFGIIEKDLISEHYKKLIEAA